MSLNLNPGYVASHWEAVEMGAERTGRTPNRADWRLVREVFVADTDEEAWRLSVDGMMGRMMGEYFLPLMGNFGFLDFFKHDTDVADSDVTPCVLREAQLAGGVARDGGGEDRGGLPQRQGLRRIAGVRLRLCGQLAGLAQFAAPAGRGGRAAGGASGPGAEGSRGIGYHVGNPGVRCAGEFPAHLTLRQAHNTRSWSAGCKEPFSWAITCTSRGVSRKSTSSRLLYAAAP